MSVGRSIFQEQKNAGLPSEGKQSRWSHLEDVGM